MNESATLGGEEKTFVALAAAMGGGCRTCAERLVAVAQSLNMDIEDINRALLEGLGVRDAATRLMREKARSLSGREGEPEDTSAGGGNGLRGLAGLAAAVAANAGSAAPGYAEAARAAGASEAAIGVAIGIGRTIRGKAQAFSDEELGAAGPGGEDSGGSPADTEQRREACGPQKACGCDEPPRPQPPPGCC